MKKINESGRSMVEMLGVLAIVGVLSIGGIAGYTTAIRAHRANEIINAASTLHVIASSKNGGTGPTNILTYSAASGNAAPYGTSDLSYFPFGTTITTTISDVSLCQEVANKLGNKVDFNNCDGSMNPEDAGFIAIDMSK